MTRAGLSSARGLANRCSGTCRLVKQHIKKWVTCGSGTEDRSLLPCWSLRDAKGDTSVMSLFTPCMFHLFQTPHPWAMRASPTPWGRPAPPGKEVGAPRRRCRPTSLPSEPPEPSAASPSATPSAWRRWPWWSGNILFLCPQPVPAGDRWLPWFHP